jgi:hypothetical protein
MDAGSIGLDPDVQLRNVRLFEVHIRRTWLALTLARRLSYIVLILLCLHAAYCMRNASSALFASQPDRLPSPFSADLKKDPGEDDAPRAWWTNRASRAAACETPDELKRPLGACQKEAVPVPNHQRKLSTSGTERSCFETLHCLRRGAKRGWLRRIVSVPLRWLRLWRRVAFWTLRGILPVWVFFGMGFYRALLLDSQLYLIRLNRVLSRFHIVFSRTARRLHKAERHSSPSPALASWSRSDTQGIPFAGARSFRSDQRSEG